MAEKVLPQASNKDAEGVPELSYENIGPARAEELLSTYRVDYRKYRDKHAKRLAQDMVNGDWVFDGSPIRITQDEFGQEILFDGQHRLHAIIISGTTQMFLVIKGLAPEAYDTTDSGIPRTYGDTLRRRGMNNVSIRVALQKLIERWEAGLGVNDSRIQSNRILDKVYDQWKDEIERAVSMASSLQHKVLMPTSMTAFAFWLLSTVDKEDAYTFMVALAEGENLRRGMPVYTLREKLRNYKEPLNRADYMYLVLRAWKAHREGRTLHSLHIPSVAVTRGDLNRLFGMPQIKGESE